MNLQEIATEAGISIDEVRERWLALRVALWKSDFRKFAKEALRIRTKAGQYLDYWRSGREQERLGASDHGNVTAGGQAFEPGRDIREGAEPASDIGENHSSQATRDVVDRSRRCSLWKSQSVSTLGIGEHAGRLNAVRWANGCPECSRIGRVEIRATNAARQTMASSASTWSGTSGKTHLR